MTQPWIETFGREALRSVHGGLGPGTSRMMKMIGAFLSNLHFHYSK